MTAVGLEAVKDDDAQYFKAFNPIVSQPWKVTKPHRKLDPSLRWEIPQYKAKLNVMKSKMMPFSMNESVNGNYEVSVRP